MFPENWYIITTEENSQIINDYYDEQKNCKCDRTLGNFIVYKDSLLNGWMYSASVKDYTKGCTEITFDQFKKYVLNIDEKKIKKTFNPIN